MANLGAVILRTVQALSGRGQPVLVLPKFKKHVYSTSGIYLDTFATTLSFSEYATFSATGGAWKTLLDVSAAGVFRGFFFTAYAVTAAGSKVTVRVTLDGRIYEEALNVESAANQMAILALGCAGASAAGTATYLRVNPTGVFPFRKSLKIELSASYAGTLSAYTDYSAEA